MKKLSNLLEKDFHIVEKRKILFSIPIVLFVIAAILMIVFRFTNGSPLNLGTDFTGGYSMQVQLGDKLTDDNYELYCNRIRRALSVVTTEDGESYSISIDGMQRQSAGTSKDSVYFKYFALKGVSESDMTGKVNDAIKRALEDKVLLAIPAVDISDKKVTLTYNEVLVDLPENPDSSFRWMKQKFIDLVPELNESSAAGIVFAGNDSDAAITLGDNPKQIVISLDAINDNATVKDAIMSGMVRDDQYSSRVLIGGMVGATVSSELLFNAILAVSLALVFMLCYIGLRFQLSSGLACIIALFHDILIMFAFMAIFGIEINSTFIAALITILGYSINNSIIIFDRVRENMRSIHAKTMTPEQIANKSIKETLMRSVNTTITTLIMIAMVAIIGVPDIRIFAIPIIVGLVAGTFSSICIAPTFWALFQRVGKNRQNFNLPPKSKKTKTKKTTTPSEVGA